MTTTTDLSPREQARTDRRDRQRERRRYGMRVSGRGLVTMSVARKARQSKEG
jgi:hypothetical protein